MDQPRDLRRAKLHLISRVAALAQPHVRSELREYLLELQASDPRSVWQAERERGLISGIDQVFHFLFDDHDFDESDIGLSLCDVKEVELISALKTVLESILDEVGDADDAVFVTHPHWPQVRRAAEQANMYMQLVSTDS